MVEEGLAFFTIIGIGHAEETVEQTDFSFLGVFHGSPMDGGLHLTVAVGHTALGHRIVGTVNLGDIAGIIFHHMSTLNNVGVFQAYLTVDGQAVELLVGVLAEVGTLDPQLFGEGNFTGARFGIFRIVHGVHFLHLVLGIVVDDELHRIQHGHGADGGLVEVLARTKLKQRDINNIVALGHANGFGKVADGSRRIAAAAQTANGGHTRVVPTVHIVLLHQLQQLTLAHDGVVKVQTGKLNLLRVMNSQCLAEPVVQWAVHLKLQCADGVRDALDGVTLTVSEVVHRIDTPFVARAMMRGVQDAVHDGVAEVHVGRRHVDFSAQHTAAIRKLARAHTAEQVKVLLHGAVAVRTLHARCSGHSPTLANLLLRLVVHICQTFRNQLFRPDIKLVEIIGGIVLFSPLETQPVDILTDRIHIFGVFFHRIRVIEAQIALSVVFLRHAEVQTDGLGVAYMKVSIGLRRKTSMYFRIIFPVLNVFFNNLLNKVHCLIVYWFYLSLSLFNLTSHISSLKSHISHRPSHRNPFSIVIKSTFTL